MIEAYVPPHHEVVEHQVFQVRSARFSVPARWSARPTSAQQGLGDLIRRVVEVNRGCRVALPAYQG